MYSNWYLPKSLAISISWFYSLVMLLSFMLSYIFLVFIMHFYILVFSHLSTTPIFIFYLYSWTLKFFNKSWKWTEVAFWVMIVWVFYNNKLFLVWTKSWATLPFILNCKLILSSLFLIYYFTILTQVANEYCFISLKFWFVLFCSFFTKNHFFMSIFVWNFATGTFIFPSLIVYLFFVY